MGHRAALLEKPGDRDFPALYPARLCSVLSPYPDHDHDSQSVCGHCHPLGLQMLGTARVNFGPQLYLGIGGYTAALMNLHFGWGPAMTLVATIAVCTVISLLLSPTTWIAKGLYFSLITLILPLTFLDVTFIWGDIFRGEVGLVGMSPLLSFSKGHLELPGLLLPVPVSDADLSSRLRPNCPLPFRDQSCRHQRE